MLGLFGYHHCVYVVTARPVRRLSTGMGKVDVCGMARGICQRCLPFSTSNNCTGAGTAEKKLIVDHLLTYVSRSVLLT